NDENTPKVVTTTASRPRPPRRPSIRPPGPCAISTHGRPAAGVCVSSVPIPGAAAPARAPDGLAASGDLARLRAVPAFASGPLQIDELSGGLTNHNVKVTTGDGRRYVARLSTPDASLLSIDRDAEHHDSVAAASTGIAPAVVD